jgi:folate-binding protein YgfZ
VDIKDQYRIIERGAGYADQSNRGRIRLTGGDAVSFLHALVTNDVASLEVGQGCHVSYLTPQGRMLADFDVLRRPDGLVCSLAPGQLPDLVTRLDGLLFSEDVEIEDVSAAWAEFAVVGARAPAVVATAFERDLQALEALDDLFQLDLPRGFVSRATDVDAPMFRVVVPSDDRDTAVGKLQAAGADPISAGLLEALRVDHGRPIWGADLDGDVIPLEAGLLDRGISTTKGCYVGQEVVIRILHRGAGRVARRLVRLAFDTSVTTPPPTGTAFADASGTIVGRLTSVSPSPTTDGLIGLAYVTRELAEVGSRVQLAGSDVTATVTGMAR